MECLDVRREAEAARPHTTAHAHSPLPPGTGSRSDRGLGPGLAGASAAAAILATRGKAVLRGRSCRVGAGVRRRRAESAEGWRRRPRRGRAGTACRPASLPGLRKYYPAAHSLLHGLPTAPSLPPSGPRAAQASAWSASSRLQTRRLAARNGRRRRARRKMAGRLPACVVDCGTGYGGSSGWGN